MVTRLLLVFICTFFIFGNISAQDYHSRWVFNSEVSPSFTTDKKRLLENPVTTRSYDWRNRVGIRTFGDLFIGIHANVRWYEEQHREIFRTDNNFSTTYGHQVENVLIGMGPFIIKYFQITDNFYLLGSGYVSLEQGRGKYRILIEDSGCITCENFPGGNQFPQVVVNKNIKDIVLNFGLDAGMAYLITPSMGVQLQVNLARFDRFSARTGLGTGSVPGNPGIDEEINLTGRSYGTLPTRPIFHVGIFSALNW